MSLKVSACDAAKYYGVSESRVRAWARDGKIPAERTPGGHFRYILEVIQGEYIPKDWNDKIIYARVSSSKQAGDLERQVIYLKEKYPDYTIVKDVGSGINYKRRGFRTVLDRLFQGNIKHVVVAHSDRWSRFGFDFFEWLFEKFSAKLESIDRAESDTAEDFTADIMEIFTVFTARYYGQRKYRQHESDQDESISKQIPEGTI